MTKKRLAILDVLTSHHGTLSAADIHASLPNIDLVTIYRSLDLFVKEKLIKQFHIDSNESVFEYQTEPHHHAICTECERVIHFSAPDEEIKALLGVEDFTVAELEVTVRGKCRYERSAKS